MARNSDVAKIADRYGLRIQDVCWEDNARNKNSCAGPRISDMTLQVQDKLMPAIRPPNFEDLTFDVPIENIPLVVGNERGKALTTITLKEYLQHFSEYIHGRNKVESLLSDGDAHALMSAQACFLPLSQDGKTKFNVALYSYQSTQSSPAVLAITAVASGAGPHRVRALRAAVVLQQGRRQV
jgi:hypothetical protein